MATWAECTNNINYSISGKSLVPLYAKFKQMKPSVEILIYSVGGRVFFLAVRLSPMSRAMSTLPRCPLASPCPAWASSTRR